MSASGAARCGHVPSVLEEARDAAGVRSGRLVGHIVVEIIVVDDGS